MRAVACAVLALLIVVTAAASTANLSVTFVIIGSYDYLVPIINVGQNKVVNSAYNLTVELYEATTHSSYRTASSSGALSGNITSPRGITSDLAFSNLANGSYRTEYRFNESGTYTMWVKATNISYGPGWGMAYIYVGQFPVNIELSRQLEFVGGDKEHIWFNLTDETSNPIVGAVGYINISYSDGSLAVQNANITEYGHGEYYYLFDVPQKVDVYYLSADFYLGENQAEYNETISVPEVGHQNTGGGGGGGGGSSWFDTSAIPTTSMMGLTIWDVGRMVYVQEPWIGWTAAGVILLVFAVGIIFAFRYRRLRGILPGVDDL